MANYYVKQQKLKQTKHNNKQTNNKTITTNQPIKQKKQQQKKQYKNEHLQCYLCACRCETTTKHARSVMFVTQLALSVMFVTQLARSVMCVPLFQGSPRTTLLGLSDSLTLETQSRAERRSRTSVGNKQMNC